MISELAGTRIGILGAGAMGQALAAGLLQRGLDADQLRAADPDPERRESAAARGVRTSSDNAAVVRDSEVVVLAVKPPLVPGLLRALAPMGAELLRSRLWVSIAAGIPLSQLAADLPARARIARAMPNTPAQVGAGATALVVNPAASDDDRRRAGALFESVGAVWYAEGEHQLDAVTGLSGSGPAYAFAFLEALADGGVLMGLPRDAAYRLAAQTLLGAAKLMLETGTPPAVLKDRVTSPGGTTITGLAELEAGGFRAAVLRAVTAATQRSRALGEIHCAENLKRGRS